MKPYQYPANEVEAVRIALQRARGVPVTGAEARAHMVATEDVVVAPKPQPVVEVTPLMLDAGAAVHGGVGRVKLAAIYRAMHLNRPLAEGPGV
jgi:hypothetical protein